MSIATPRSTSRSVRLGSPALRSLRVFSCGLFMGGNAHYASHREPLQPVILFGSCLHRPFQDALLLRASDVMHASMNAPLRNALLFAVSVFSISAPLRAETPLGEQMDAMKAAFRNLKTAMEAPVDADKDKYIASAEELKSAAVKAKEFDPKKLGEIPEGDREQFLADYRQSIDQLIALIDQLKTQLAAGDWDAARAQIRLINRAQGDGHEKFRSEES